MVLFSCSDTECRTQALQSSLCALGFSWFGHYMFILDTFSTSFRNWQYLWSFVSTSFHTSEYHYILLSFVSSSTYLMVHLHSFFHTTIISNDLILCWELNDLLIKLPSLYAVLVALLPFFQMLPHPELSFHLYQSHCFFYSVKEVMASSDKVIIPGKAMNSGSSAISWRKQIQKQ